jgi:hypothetical protein
MACKRSKNSIAVRIQNRRLWCVLFSSAIGVPDHLACCSKTFTDLHYLDITHWNAEFKRSFEVGNDQFDNEPTLKNRLLFRWHLLQRSVLRTSSSAVDVSGR